VGISVGDKTVFSVSADQNSMAYDRVTISGKVNGDTTGAKTFTNWDFNDDVLDNKTTSLNFYSIDTTTGKELSGTTFDGKISLSAGGIKTSAPPITFDFKSSLGQVASLDTKLKDLDKFYDNNGKFLLDDAAPVTLIQGNGKQIIFNIFGTDTIQDVVDKFNSAIADGLGQKAYISSGDSDKFVSYVTKANASGPESVEGTLLVRSAIAGADGEIKVVGGEPLEHALGLVQIQNSSENRFTIDISDAHSSKVISQGVQITGNNLIGAINPNVDVKFDSNADIITTYDKVNHKFVLTGDSSHPYSTYVHLVDNSMTFQIGANQLQDMNAAIGDMSSEALNVRKIKVTDRDSAGRAITIIDSAISRVSSQRSSLGAVQNRLEHTINNLGVANENMTAAESRIRDVDMSAEMMELTKMNILAQASSAMLTQANQIPNMVLQLLK
jgi:flagellin